MLLHLALDPSRFVASLAQIQTAYFPRREYEAYLTQWFTLHPHNEGEASWHDYVDTAMGAAVRALSEQPFYVASSEPRWALPLPFLHDLHELFLQRKNELVPNQGATPAKLAADVTRLDGEEREELRSANAGKFHHFVNVVAVVARMVQFFSGDVGVARLAKSLRLSRDEARVLAYPAGICPLTEPEEPRSDELRVLLLMLGAFYHDLGKVITNSRHAMEGANLLVSRGITPPMQLTAVVRGHGLGHPGRSMQRAVVAHLSNLVRYHDLFGTLSTGEQSYAALVEPIHAAKQAARFYGEGQEVARKWTRRTIFDLWLLNAADTLVSLRRPDLAGTMECGKDQPHRKWEDVAASEAALLEYFISNAKSSSFLHDVRLALRFVDVHTEHTHMDTCCELGETAHRAAERHVAERVTRLVSEVVVGAIADRRKLSVDVVESSVATAQPFEDAVLSLVLDLPSLGDVVSECLRSGGDFSALCRRARLIGQMDYALGFFQTLAQEALRQVCRELTAKDSAGAVGVMGPHATHWISSRQGTAPDTNATFFVENLSAVVVDTIRYLVFRGEEPTRVLHWEFKEATSRLATSERRMEMLSMAGPYRAQRMRELVLNTVLMW